MTNFVLLSDSYKYSHFVQYPENTKAIFSYLESRGGQYDKVIFNGLKYYLDNYLDISNFADMTYDIVESLPVAEKHGIPFNEIGWHKLHQYINYNERLPIQIRAVAENVTYPTNVALMTIENTHEDFFWLTNWLETLLMKVWYPCTVATRAFHIKELLRRYYMLSSDNQEAVNWAYHNFGDRGSSSVESALIGGLAHLSQFHGTDNFNAASYHIMQGGIAGSIPASEHSTVTSWGRENEFKFIRNYLELYKGKPIVACVLDSYNIYDAVNYVTSSLKPIIESAEYPTLVMRPDSGNPVTVLHKILAIMDLNKVAFKTNSKGFKVWDKYRIIWGDGVNEDTIKTMLEILYMNKISAECIAFGSGGNLMQQLDRDTCKFAIKCSAVKIGDKWQDVYKQPVDAPDKVSKKGRLTTVYTESADGTNSEIKTIRMEDFDSSIHRDLMTIVY